MVILLALEYEYCVGSTLPRSKWIYLNGIIWVAQTYFSTIVLPFLLHLFLDILCEARKITGQISARSQ